MGDQRELRLPIRLCRTLEPDGDVVEEETAFCPVRGRSRAVDECRCCGVCGGVVHTNGDQPYVVCTAAQPRAHRTWFADDAPVRELMSPSVSCIREQLSLARAHALLLDSEQQALPVVDAAGHPIGVLSRTDLLPLVGCEGLTVGQVMTPFATVISESAPLAQAAALMALEGVHQLPVISAGADKAVVGFVTALDLSRWIARESGYLGEGTPL
jgi:CBS domain-containing protein